MSNAYDSVAEWLEHAVTQRMIQKVNETKYIKQTEVRYSPTDIKGGERDIGSIAMFNAYSQGLLEGLNEIVVIKDEIISESKGVKQDGN
jgi:hypothetical protein